ncbi:hypothetical protein [Burkholderia guangdongensis]|uniref:hypothetical protein n=1 Tax=Burkholderia guangdongensis TaxID=1792500 RepID=UPI0015CAD5F2|nr:hypothetical protein [Burkholderia guangdongensis]
MQIPARIPARVRVKSTVFAALHSDEMEWWIVSIIHRFTSGKNVEITLFEAIENVCRDRERAVAKGEVADLTGPECRCFARLQRFANSRALL